MGIGLSGLLGPDGTFHPCDYGKHAELIAKLNIPRYKMDTYIPMSSRRLPVDMMERYGWDSAVFIQWGKGLTQAQADWIREHKYQFDQEQYRTFIRLLLELLDKNEIPIVTEEKLWDV